MDKIEELNELIQLIEKEREALFAAKEPIDAKLVKTYDELEKLKNERDSLIIESNTTGELDFETILRPDLSTVMYREANNQLSFYGLQTAWLLLDKTPT